jgi:hypothetical protein
VLTVLRARQIIVSADEQAHILACADLDRLEAWLQRAVVVTRAAELFEAH